MYVAQLCRIYSFCVNRIGSHFYSIRSCIAFLKLIKHAIPQTDLVNARFFIFLQETRRAIESK